MLLPTFKYALNSSKERGCARPTLRRGGLRHDPAPARANRHEQQARNDTVTAADNRAQHTNRSAHAHTRPSLSRVAHAHDRQLASPLLTLPLVRPTSQQRRRVIISPPGPLPFILDGVGSRPRAAAVACARARLSAALGGSRRLSPPARPPAAALAGALRRTAQADWKSMHSLRSVSGATRRVRS